MGYKIVNCACVKEEKPPEPNKDPCADAKKNDTRSNNNTISSQTNVIRTKTVTNEFGAEQNLNSFPPLKPENPYYNHVSPREGSSNGFAPNFSWNATEGYTIGVSHGHPGDSTPSPADLVNAFSYLSDAELQAGGQAAIDYFKANFSVSIVTQNETFTINVTDWDKLREYYTAYKKDETAGDLAFKNKGQEYLDKNPADSGSSNVTLYAGLKLYGSAVNITKLDKGTTTSKPINLDANGNIIKSPCP